MHANACTRETHVTTLAAYSVTQLYVEITER